MRNFLILLILLIFSVHVARGQNACARQKQCKIRVIGDSWAQFPYVYHAYDTALAKYGFADYYAIGDATALIGMQAEVWWQFPLARFALEAALNTDAARPIELVMVSLGGNDAAFGVHATDSLSVLDDNLANSKLFMDSIFDFVHEKIPNAHIIWQGYDYPNFVDALLNYPWNPYRDLWESRGEPTPFMVNRVVDYMMQHMDTTVQGYHRVGKNYIHYFNCMGLMQWLYGQTTPLRVAPFGTYPPHSVPFPGGDWNYPTPYIAMGLNGLETYHLGPMGYTELCNFYMRAYINAYFRRNKSASVYSMGTIYDGAVNTNGNISTGSVVVSNNGVSKNKGIFSFNTEFIPDNYRVKKASLFIKNKSIQNRYTNYWNPFPDNFVLEIKKGAFGSSAVEAGDFNEPSDYFDAACVVGCLQGNDYSLRFDLNDNALAFINKTGITQFRLSINDTNVITFYNGDTTAFEGPYLDLYYDTTTITTIRNNTLQTIPFSIFPTVSRDYIKLALPTNLPDEKMTISIITLDGKVAENLPLSAVKLNTIDISKLPAAEYLVQVKSSDKMYISRFIKPD